MNQDPPVQPVKDDALLEIEATFDRMWAKLTANRGKFIEKSQPKEKEEIHEE